MNIDDVIWEVNLLLPSWRFCKTIEVFFLISDLEIAFTSEDLKQDKVSYGHKHVHMTAISFLA